MRIRAFETSDEDAVVALWQRCGLTRPWNDPRKDIARKLTVQPAVAPGHRGKGLGRRLMEEVERRLVERGCPKLNMQVRRENTVAIAFYGRLGYLPDDAVALGKRLIPD